MKKPASAGWIQMRFAPGTRDRILAIHGTDYELLFAILLTMMYPINRRGQVIGTFATRT